MSTKMKLSFLVSIHFSSMVVVKVFMLLRSKIPPFPFLMTAITITINPLMASPSSGIGIQLYFLFFPVLHWYISLFSLGVCCLVSCFWAIWRNYFTLVSCRCGFIPKSKLNREQCDSYLFCKDLTRVKVIVFECHFTKWRS